MRQLIILLFCCANIAFATTKKTSPKSDALNGIWISLQQELGGKKLSPSTFENQKLTLLDNTYILMAESADRGFAIYSNGKMDIYGKDGVNAGKHFTAIYKLENDMLTICYNLEGDIYPTKFETNGNPKFFLSVFKRELLKETIIIKNKE